MIHCFHAVKRQYLPEDIIWNYDGSNHAVGIVETGSAIVVRIDRNGSRTILEELEQNGLFGELLLFSQSTRDSIFAVARTACTVLFVDFGHFVRRCPNACACHSRLVENMLQLLSDKAVRQGERIEILSRRGIREKLLCYFRILSERQNSPDIELPLARNALADYLCVDRSAMSRELANMKRDGLIRIDMRRVTLLRDD